MFEMNIKYHYALVKKDSEITNSGPFRLFIKKAYLGGTTLTDMPKSNKKLDSAC